MKVNRPSVEGPQFARLVREVDAKVKKLEANDWNFKSVPETFARDASADVVAKELVHIFDGHSMTRVGQLVMGGVGTHFNLMGPIPSDSKIQVTDAHILDEVNRQLGSEGLVEIPQFRKFGRPQKVDFYNYGMFYTLRDMVFWLLLHDAGCFPSTLEHMVRNFAAGHVVQNYNYAPARPSRDLKTPSFMAAACLMVSFPSTAIEWMDKPLFGGLAKDTVHIETLLTLTPSKVSHPHLPLTHEGKVRFGHQTYYARRFSGVSQKDGVRGPKVPPERSENSRSR
jgi:hypothetical protein